MESNELIDNTDSANPNMFHEMSKGEQLMAQVDVNNLLAIDHAEVDMFNKMIEHLGIELASLQSEAQELWKIVEQICEHHYNEPHLAFNKKIQEENVRKGKYRFKETGHLVTEVRVDKKIGRNRPDDLCLGLFIKDYGRTFDGKPKKMNWVPEGEKSKKKMEHKVLPKYPKSMTSNNPPVRVACQPFCWEDIKTYGTAWEGEMLRVLARRVHPILRRYFYLVDTYQRLLDERTSLYRDLAVNLGIIPRKGYGKSTYKQLIPIFEKYFPEINIHEIDLSSKSIHQKSTKDNEKSKGAIYG